MTSASSSVAGADLSQWFTPEPIARRMVELAGAIKPRSILEPSAGSGRLVAACRERWPYAAIEAVEVDPHYARALRRRFLCDGTSVQRASFLEYRPTGGGIFDLCVMNPPFEDGLDGRFLARAMDMSKRVIALVRLAALTGQARSSEVWSRCQPGGDFGLAWLCLFKGRPRFEAGRSIGSREDGGAAKTDFCVVHLVRRELLTDDRTFVEWW